MFLKHLTWVMPLLWHIPLLRPLGSFRPAQHWNAGCKFVVMWSFSLLPLVLSGLMTELQGEDKLLDKFVSGITKEFKPQSLFVFAISFLVPMLYMFFERHRRLTYYAFSRKKAPTELSLPEGFNVVLYGAIIVFVFSTFAYAPSTSPTVLAALVNKGQLQNNFLIRS